MSMLDELLRQLQEAAEQQRTQPIPGQPRPKRQPVVLKSADEKTMHEAKFHAVPVTDGEEPVHRLVENSKPAIVASTRWREHPLLARMRTPEGMRDAVILAEIMRRPGRR